jgi:hypothetical protein
MAAAIRVDERDNVATALQELEVGTEIEVGDRVIHTAQRVPPGHKVAVVAIGCGEPVIKYGQVVGVATQDIPVGAVVHVSNMRDILEDRRSRR